VGGVRQPTYIMLGMVAWGTMAAVIATGNHIATERSMGWNRQLRLTPLSAWAYLFAKAISGFAMAAVTIVLLYLAGVVLGVRLGIGGWLEMTGLVFVGLIPFALLGILVGQLVGADAIGPAVGGVTALLALLGGSWGPIATGGWTLAAVEWLPSYWLVQASKASVGGGAWPAKGWLVIAVWTVVLAAVTYTIYGRATERS